MDCNRLITCIGNTPTFTSGRPKITLSAATAMSVMQSSPMPPAMQTPPTRAIAGLVAFCDSRSRSA